MDTEQRESGGLSVDIQVKSHIYVYIYIDSQCWFVNWLVDLLQIY